MLRFSICLAVVFPLALVSAAQAADLAGSARDETGGALPGVSVELRGGALSMQTTTDGQWRYRFDVPPGRTVRVTLALGF